MEIGEGEGCQSFTTKAHQAKTSSPCILAAFDWKQSNGPAPRNAQVSFQFCTLPGFGSLIKRIVKICGPLEAAGL